MSDPSEAVRRAQDAAHKVREEAIKRDMRAQRMREQAEQRVAASKKLHEKTSP